MALNNAKAGAFDFAIGNPDDHRAVDLRGHKTSLPPTRW
jgi:hypothetical protein